MSRLAFAGSSTKLSLPLSLLGNGVSGDAQLERTGDGNVCWILAEGTELATIRFDLERLQIRPRDFNEIHIRFKADDAVQWEPELTAYPVKGLRRHWYSKMALKIGEWQTARFDLDRDDDGWWVGGDSNLEQCALNLVLRKEWRRTSGEKKERIVEVESVILVRRTISVDFDELAARPIDNVDEIGWRYDLCVTNNELHPQTVELRLDLEQTKHFQTNWKCQNFQLQPREQRIVALEISMPIEEAQNLPPLYSERVQVYATSHEADSVEITPLRGFRPRYLWATLPPAATHFLPIHHEEEENQQAAELLMTDWGVPTHGPALHPQAYYNSATSETPIPLSWFRHQDPQTGEIFSDDQRNLSYIHRIHADNFERANTLADAFLASGDLRFAAGARDVLLEYARQYPFLRPSAPDATSGRSRLGLNTLMSSYLFPKVCDAYSKIRDSTALGKADREAIENGFIKAEALAIYTHDIGYSNMQAEHYKAYTHAAFALNYWPLMGEAIYGDHGFNAMVEYAFSQDGISHEAGVYHWSTLSAMVEFAEFLAERGIDVMNERFKRVFDGMVHHSPQGIYEDARCWKAFDFAYRVYREPAYIPTLKAAGMWPSTYLETEEIREAEAMGGQYLVKNSLLPNAGYLWLREQSEAGFWALSINYILQWDRGEHDRLHFSLFDESGRLSAEVGRIIYSDPAVRTMERTLAHNSVVVDEKSQNEAPSVLAAFLDRPALPAALIIEDSKSPLYSGLQFSRAVALLDGLFFVGDLYSGDAEHTFDWPFYAPWQPDSPKGIAVPQIPLDLSPLDSLGYDWMRHIQGAHSDEAVRVSLPIAGANSEDMRELCAHFAPMNDALFVSAQVPRGFRPQSGPMLLVRQAKRSQARFGVVFSVNQNNSPTIKIENLPVATANGEMPPAGTIAAWRVLSPNGIYTILINRSCGKVRLDDSLTSEVFSVTRTNL